MDSIVIFNARTGKLEEEKVFGKGALRFLYKTRPGLFIERFIASRKPLSWIYGLYNDSKWSACRIENFVRDFGIPMDSFVVPSEGFSSFNDFFIRPFREGERKFPEQGSLLGAFGEGRYLVATKLPPHGKVRIKGVTMDLSQFLGTTPPWAFSDVVIARLCPVDYHRFHFFDDGRVVKIYDIPGVYHSVNPWALEACSEAFLKNHRVVSLLQTKQFGEVFMVEVAATCVGSVVSTKKDGESFVRGEEKGYFKFGASTVIIVLESGRVNFNQDLLERSTQGIETLFELGHPLNS